MIPTARGSSSGCVALGGLGSGVAQLVAIDRKRKIDHAAESRRILPSRLSKAFSIRQPEVE
jgi:hypothetical protein